MVKGASLNVVNFVSGVTTAATPLNPADCGFHLLPNEDAMHKKSDTFYDLPCSYETLANMIPTLSPPLRTPLVLDYVLHVCCMCNMNINAFLCTVNYRGSTGFGQDSIYSLPGKVGTQDVLDVQVLSLLHHLQYYNFAVCCQLKL